MFARKGTTVRRARRSVRRPRPTSSPGSSTPRQMALEPELGSDNRAISQGDLSHHRPSTAPTISSTSSLRISLPVLDDERSLCRSTSGFSDDKFQQTSYGSILYQLREVQSEATDVFDFLQRTFEVVWDSLILTVFFTLLLALPIAMIAVGTSYQHECPREPRIPIYLLVGGAFGAIQVVILLYQQKKSRDYNYMDEEVGTDDDDFDDNVMTRSCRFTCYVLSAFLVAWFVLGNVWVLKVWKPNFQQPLHDPQNWCHEVVFYFAFYQLLAVYGLAGVFLLGILVSMVTYAVRKQCSM